MPLLSIPEGSINFTAQGYCCEIQGWLGEFGKLGHCVNASIHIMAVGGEIHHCRWWIGKWIAGGEREKGKGDGCLVDCVKRKHKT